MGDGLYLGKMNKKALLSKIKSDMNEKKLKKQQIQLETDRKQAQNMKLEAERKLKEAAWWHILVWPGGAHVGPQLP